MGSVHQPRGYDGLGETGDRAKWGGSSPHVWRPCRWKPQQVSGAGYALLMGRASGLPMCLSHSQVELVLASQGVCLGCHPHPRWLFCMQVWALPVCLRHRVVSGWSLRSGSIIYLSGFWANGHLCSLCYTLYLLQPPGPEASPLWVLCRSWPLLQMVLTLSESSRCCRI